MVALLLHRLPDFLLIVMSGWLGLHLLVRAPHEPDNRTFAWFCILLVFYSISALQAQLTTHQPVVAFLHREHLAARVLAPAGFLHFVAVFTARDRLPPLSLALVNGGYAIGIALALYAFAGPLPDPHTPFPAWSTWGEPRFPDGLINWAALAQQTILPVVALVLLWRSYQHTPGIDEKQTRGHRTLVLAALVGVVGTLATAIAHQLAISLVIPHSLIIAGLLIATYAVITHQIMLPGRLSHRAFIYTLLGSLFTIGYLILAIALEWVSGEILHINIPIATILSIIGLAAALGPAGEWMRSQIDRRFYPREFDYTRLLKSLSDELFERGGLNDQLDAGLSLICRALDVEAGFVAIDSPDGPVVAASYGEEHPPANLCSAVLPDELVIVEEPWAAWPPARLLIPLCRDQMRMGVLVFGQRGSGHHNQLFSPTEHALLNHLGNYMALTIDHARSRDEHQAILVTLTEQSQMLRQQQEQLSQQATEAVQQVSEIAASKGGLRVYALGTLYVEREGERITRWGGSKAGTYQAEALFAFLFDRRGKGVSKDEVEEIIWPDLEIARADSAFHRTLAGLRRTLEPGLRRGNLSKTILYHHDRYWLEPGVVPWCDSEAFLSATERGATLFHQGQYSEALEALESASTLYRGAYMDDCPFFGDSAYVEEQREMFRARSVEVQLLLGAIYETQNRAGEALSAYHRALSLSLDGSAPASEGIARLQEGLVG